MYGIQCYSIHRYLPYILRRIFITMAIFDGIKKKKKKTRNHSAHTQHNFYELSYGILCVCVMVLENRKEKTIIARSWRLLWDRDMWYASMQFHRWKYRFCIGYDCNSSWMMMIACWLCRIYYCRHCRHCQHLFFRSISSNEWNCEVLSKSAF